VLHVIWAAVLLSQHVGGEMEGISPPWSWCASVCIFLEDFVCRSVGQITGTLVDGQTIRPNHWHARRRKDNSAKSLERSSLVDGKTILPNHWHARRRTDNRR
jgi:hypothetical protein